MHGTVNIKHFGQGLIATATFSDRIRSYPLEWKMKTYKENAHISDTAII